MVAGRHHNRLLLPLVADDRLIQGSHLLLIGLFLDAHGVDLDEALVAL